MPSERRADDSAALPTLAALLQWRAQQQPDQRGYTFLGAGTEVEHLSYAQLDQRARGIAAALQRLDAAGQRVLLLYPPGLDYLAAFFGCLYAGAIAVPAYPPHNARRDRSLGRLRAIVQDAQPLVALTTSAILPTGETLAAQDQTFGALHWLASDSLPLDASADWQALPLRSGTLAFLQYTSGSTAAPKGVMLTHANLLHNSRLIRDCFGHSTASRGVIWLPPYHDMGLIGGVIQPLFVGFPVTLMSPVTFLQRPIRWLQAISETRATTSGGPNFAYDLCTRKITPEQRATLDLSNWTVAFNGAEPIRADTLERFAAAFAPCGFRREAFYPCYGLAEATLLVAGGQLDTPPIVRAYDEAALSHNQALTTDQQSGRRLVSSGRNVPEQQILVVDPETAAPCPTTRIGEIWVAGPSVAQGYWNRPDDETFQAQLASRPETRFLRTGDLGFFDGEELFITGRLKDLIILRGRNHYPQDIELTVERCHPALRPGSGAAFTIEVDGEERLVIVQEVERQQRRVDVALVAAAIRRAVAEEHELQVYAVMLLTPGGLPKTSSGKVQRRACREALLAGKLNLLGSDLLSAASSPQETVDLTREAVLALDPAERSLAIAAYLHDQIARTLGVDRSLVQPQQPISAQGLDSLMALELHHAVQDQLGVAIPLASFLQDLTIVELAESINRQLAERSAPAPPEFLPVAASAGEYPLSFGQRALWFLYQLAPESAAYHIVSAVRMRGQLDPMLLHRAVQQLVDRHPALRTAFVRLSAGDPLQRIASQRQADFQIVPLPSGNYQRYLADEAQRPFDLARDSLLRVRLIPLSAAEHLLLLVAHHIILDFWSLVVLTQELSAIYQAERASHPPELEPLTFHYLDYVHWQTELLAGPDGDRLWEYWSRQLSDAPTVLDLATDRPRPPVQRYRGATHAFVLDAALTRQIQALAQSAGATLFMTLLAAFQVLLHRYTGQRDILVGSPMTGRSRSEFAGIVGYLVNPVALRARLSGDMRFAALLEQIRQTVRAAFAHQDYPFALLVERLQPQRDPSRSPLFQVMFVLQKAQLLNDTGLNPFAVGLDGAQIALADLTIESVALEQQATQLDLTLSIAEVDGVLAAAFQYNRDLFDPETIARMAEHFGTLLHSLVTRPDQPIGSLPLLPAAEQQRLLIDWNATQAPYPADQCFHTLVEAQARRTPDAIAVVAGEQQLSYRSLNARANQLARYLRACGVRPELRVGLCIERSPELVIALLAILKAGGVYVPLDPVYPQERLRFMLQDAEVAVLLTTTALAERLPAVVARTICLDADHSRIERESEHNLNTSSEPDNLAYMIYTSGSTGRPKGVLIPHRGLVNLALAQGAAFAVTPQSRVLQFAALSFDASISELAIALTAGAQLELLPGSTPLVGADLAALIERRAITHVTLPPSVLATLPYSEDARPLPALKTLIVAGEACGPELAARWGRGRRFVNAYGPTETTVCATVELGSGDGTLLPIGRPIANTTIYLLDALLQPVPIGVPGELYIGGIQLARGYNRRPDLTAEKFVPNPFDATGGARLYRSGDRARSLPDGRIVFLGRSDQQVKIRGFRVELGEIAAVLSEHPAVKDVAVVAREDRPGDTRIVAYIVGEHENTGTNEQTGESTTRIPKGNPGDSAEPDSRFRVPFGRPGSSDLRAFLETRLPAYMLPSAFVLLPALPLTTSGKLDRDRLPAPERDRAQLQAAVVPPRTPTETLIAGIWRELLQIDRIGIHDHFFEIGGHSLLATQAISRLRDTFQIDLPVHRIFEMPTIAALAQYIDTIRRAAQDMHMPLDDDDREEGRL
jgi:amino acid adenylation domain-containing protein